MIQNWSSISTLKSELAFNLIPPWSFSELTKCREGSPSREKSRLVDSLSRVPVSAIISEGLAKELMNDFTLSVFNRSDV